MSDSQRAPTATNEVHEWRLLGAQGLYLNYRCVKCLRFATAEPFGHKIDLDSEACQPLPLWEQDRV